MVSEDIIQRKLLIEQTRKEILDILKTYQVGYCHNGQMLATKDSEDWQGYLFVIPDDVWKELFKEA